MSYENLKLKQNFSYYLNKKFFYFFFFLLTLFKNIISVQLHLYSLNLFSIKLQTFQIQPFHLHRPNVYPRFCYEKNFPMRIRWTTVKILLKSKSNPNSVREKVGNRNHFNTRHSWWINISFIIPFLLFLLFLFWIRSTFMISIPVVSIKYATFVYIKTESKSWLTIQKFTKFTRHESQGLYNKYDRTSFIGIYIRRLMN